MTRDIRSFKSPDPKTFLPIIQRSVFRDNPEQILRAMQYLEEQLAKGFRLRMRPGEVQELAGYTSVDDPAIKRFFAAQPFHLYFYPSVTVDGTLILTLLVEAKPEELRQRKRNYTNANKFLFNPIVSADGMIRKDPATYAADREIATTTEHTAHTKFYLQPVMHGNKMVGISMLLHPFQRARLKYDPKHDPQFANYKERANRLAGHINRLCRILSNKSPEQYRNEIKTLQRIRLAIEQLRGDINQSGSDVNIYLKEMESLLPKIPASRKRSRERSSLFDVFTITRAEANRQDPDKSGGHAIKSKTTPLRQLLLRFLRDTEHFLNMRNKRGHEAEYQSANVYSSRIRELVLLDASSLVTKSFEHVLKIPVKRYMLTSKQLRQMRLKHGKGNVYVNMARIPEYFERRGKPMEELPVPVQLVDEHGKLFGKPTTQRIGLVSIDAPKNRRRGFKSRKLR